MVDGGSTDRTFHIANSFALILGARLVIHSGPDQGIYDAMNRGIAMATGTWLLFLGADDTLYEADTLRCKTGTTSTGSVSRWWTTSLKSGCRSTLGYRPWRCLADCWRPLRQKDSRRAALGALRRMPYVRYQARKARSRSIRQS